MEVPVERLDRSKFNFGDYDIIHTNGIRPDFFAFRNRKKIKYHISTIHNFVFDDLSYQYNKLVSLIFGYIWLIIWRRADRLICVSEVMKSYYKKWFSSSKLEVTYNGITESDNSFIPEEGYLSIISSFKSRGLKVIGSAGILTRIKGIEQILKLISKEKKLALVIIGKGRELHNLQRMAKKLEITDRCFFCGFRSNAVNYFGYFDLFIIPSRSEGFGLVLIEAVQKKIPVVCSDIEVFRELFNPDEVTFFKLDDIRSLAEAIQSALENGKKKVDLAYARYQAHYTDKLMGKSYFELYQSA
jgi:glycosyltransferase involved in cell wall biosynthesis